MRETRSAAPPRFLKREIGECFANCSVDQWAAGAGAAAGAGVAGAGVAGAGVAGAGVAGAGVAPLAGGVSPDGGVLLAGGVGCAPAPGMLAIARIAVSVWLMLSM